MNSIGKKISDTRKQKGFTQEELAELSKVNLRTIQRIENNKNEPRGKTLSLICDALEIDKLDLQELNEFSKNRSVANFFINGIYLILLNIVLTCIILYLSVDSEANVNSRIGALLLSFLIPFFIVCFVQNMKGIERVLKFSIGWGVCLTTLFFAQGLRGGMAVGFRTWIFSCMLIYVGVLFYGNILFNAANIKNKE
ncbi:helix-turn-helix domain-containing protein [Flavobacterium mesophilum]|uniref:helix-turn-helix domain-containing protein n=1 Tax=Flavobacterium mesophilum TaxID=3143495 RepID=UPI0031D69060